MTINILLCHPKPIESGTQTLDDLNSHQQKEYRAFSDFSRSKDFVEIMEKATGHKPYSHNAAGNPHPDTHVTIDFPTDDPPDIRLHINGQTVGIEVTDFPPNQQPLSDVCRRMEYGHTLPLLSQAGQNPNEIERWIRPELPSQGEQINKDKKQWAMPDTVSPRFVGNNAEVQKLADHLIKIIPKKDKPTNQVLLLHGALFSTPEKEAIKLALSKISIRYLKVIVLVLQDESIPFYIATPRTAPSS